MQIILPDNVKLIIKTLMDKGFEAYAVGGCVRDSLLGKIPNDWDITTSASPMEVKSLFRRTIDTGIQHGTVTIMFDKEGYEVTTYRIDGEYEDSRHPKEVVFTKSLSEDLRRRDFTINAMAYNDIDGIVDLFDGLNDLKVGIIKAVGNPEERFGEDALRILRAIRFSAQLNYKIDNETYKAIEKLANTLEKISAERIRVEIQKLLVSSHPEMLNVMFNSGVSKVVLPELDRMMETEQNTPHHLYTVGIHTIHALINSCEYDSKLTDDQRKIVRLAIMLHDSGKPKCKTTGEDGKDHFYGHAKESEEIAGEVLHRLKYDNDTIKKVKLLVKYHDHRKELTEPKVRKTVVDITKELIPLWIIVRKCDVCAQSQMNREKKLAEISDFEKVYEKIICRNDCLSIKELAVTGKDLIDLGIKPGPELGEILNNLFEHVLNIPEHNNKEYLLNMAKSSDRGCKE